MLVCEADLAVDRRHRLAQAILKAIDIDFSCPYEADFLGSWKQRAQCLSRPEVKRRIGSATNRGLAEQAGRREPGIVEILAHPGAAIRILHHATERLLAPVAPLLPQPHPGQSP